MQKSDRCGALHTLMANDKYLAIYFNDHLAGATVGVELARRLAGENKGTTYAKPLRRLAKEIEEDRDALKDLMERFDVGTDPLKFAGAWIGEKVGRLKLNGELMSYSPLSRLEELEMLSLGVEGKASLWRSLSTAIDGDARADGIDFDTLNARAAGQREILEDLRRRAALEAFA